MFRTYISKGTVKVKYVGLHVCMWYNSPICIKFYKTFEFRKIFTMWSWGNHKIKIKKIMMHVSN